MIRSIFASLTLTLCLPTAIASAGELDNETTTETVETTVAPSDQGHEDKDADDRAALEQFKKHHEKVLELVRKKASEKEIEAQVDNLIDYQMVAWASLGGQKKYAERCAPRCDEFEKLLTKLIRENYLKRIRKSDRGELTYGKYETRKDMARIETIAKWKAPNGRTETMRVFYVMQRRADGRFVVSGFSADGVNVTKNWYYEFNKVMRDEGIDGLIARLQSKVDEIAKVE